MKHRVFGILGNPSRNNTPQIANFTWPTWGSPGSCRPQGGPMLAPWTLLSGGGGGGGGMLTLMSTSATERRWVIHWPKLGAWPVTERVLVQVSWELAWTKWGSEAIQGLYSLSDKTSYRQISWSLEAARLGFIMIVSLWNLTGISAALLPRCLLNFRAILKVKTRISRLRDFTRSCGKTSYRLVNRGPKSGVTQQTAYNQDTDGLYISAT